MSAPARVLILGAGFSGFTLARRLRKDAAAGRIELTVVEPEPYLTYKPLLPEVAGGETAPEAVLVPLRGMLKHARIVAGSVETVDAEAKVAVVRSLDGTQRPLSFDHVVFALGSVSKTLPIPGLAENAVGFSTVEEAVFLRDQVLDRVRFAAETQVEAERRRALTFVVVGGGYTGVEALAELQQLSARAIARYPELAGQHAEWVLVEAAGRIAAELPDELSDWTLTLMRRRGVTVRLHTELSSCEQGLARLSDGTQLPTVTIVWAAGVTPNPVVARAGVPRGEKGHIRCDERLRVVDASGAPLDGVWALGDDAEVPKPGSHQKPAFYPPTAQNAVRQAKVLADGLRAAIEGTEPPPYRHRSLGMMASYGGHAGAADLRGLKLRGAPAWAVDKLYHAAVLPGVRKRVRLVLGWVANGLAGRETVSTAAVRHPRRPFAEAAAQQRE
ncbi:NAD(P)/FAD-dependent oxidoreductase [Leifsonia sp. AG29]|uniref:NAD(P)/FAD-dependent oxidoreductase n=1 Tax=Leifsonia sp. AG29 TaxID=2598860 RepID=UPI00131CA713|nr:FAD-dependent oxidoreductase [Leifsonia sp. AG29]